MSAASNSGLNAPDINPVRDSAAATDCSTGDSSKIVTITLNPAIDQTASIPNFTPDAVNRVVWEQADPGGKGVNVASFLADFGLRSTVSGWLGAENPELFEKLFQQKGIADRFVRVAGKTRVNVKIVDDIQQQVTDINFPGHPPTESDLERLQEAIDQLVTDHNWFILSGSVPEGVPETVYHDLVAGLKRVDKMVVLDTSGPRLRAALAAQPDLIKPNRVELEEVLGRTLDSKRAIARAARELIQQGLKLVVVSMGSDGALYVSADEAIHAQPPRIEVKSTVGAGDAMVAGTVAAWVEGKSLADCALLGTAFAMGALTQIGPRLPPKNQILAYQPRITLRTL